jgi:hypothetical protein
VTMLAETLVAAVGFGDDTDTFAAMVGGIAGSGTPRHSLPDWGTMAGRESLVAWGRAIDRSGPIDDLPGILDVESELTSIVRH